MKQEATWIPQQLGSHHTNPSQRHERFALVQISTVHGRQAIGWHAGCSSRESSEPTTGNSRRRHGALPTGYSRIPSRSVSMMNARTTKPVNAPITSPKIRKTCPSRCRSSPTRGNSQVLHQLPLVVWTSSPSLGNVPQEHVAPRRGVTFRNLPDARLGVYSQHKPQRS